MILSTADRQRIADAFRERIGPLALPADVTVDALCTNLVLAIPALLETCNALERECERLAAHAEGLELERQNVRAAAALRGDRLQSELDNANARIAALEAQLKEDPCP